MNQQQTLIRLFESWCGESHETAELLPPSGSDRRYYRLTSKNHHAIGAWNPDVRENQAFITLSRHFNDAGLPVPAVFAVDHSQQAYLQNDLGDITLFSLLSQEGLSENVKALYRDAVKLLPRFQVDGAINLDFNVCYPRKAFDLQSMRWDLNYFKYYFARLSGFGFDEQALEDDFDRLTGFLLSAENTFFLYRDFQSRNIMIYGGKPCFIDFQGGRQGPLQYDLASLIYDAKANLPREFRNELLGLYMKEISLHTTIDPDDFTARYRGFILIRILQALGAYGFRGFYQKKEHFLQSIPYALNNLDYLLTHEHPGIELPALEKLLRSFIQSDTMRNYAKPGLKVRITSFSYRKQIPSDTTGNGGGFVFDCRALPNPGRLEEYRKLTGRDETVIRYLAGHHETGLFLGAVYTLVDQAVENYLSRKFTNLMVSFGCTGGQHRSVYCAEQLSAHLNKRFGLNIKPEHTQKEEWTL
ncbi:MAG TPA: RNase adapter RapZ [Lentimicrobium sp.]|nr:RNase adapter RapZ [Lentimicrobium sp.]